MKRHLRTIHLALLACGLILAPSVAGADGATTEGQDRLRSRFKPFFFQSTARSGTRLKAEYAVHAPGVRHFWQFWDAELNTACNFAQDAAGGLRCYPETTTIVSFSDPGCTRPIVVFPAPFDGTPLGPVPNALSERLFDAQCGPFDEETAFSAFEILHPVATATVYEGSPSRCSRSFFQPQPGDRIFDLREVPDEELVKGELGLRFSGGSRLLERVVRGEDGSRSPLNLSTGSFRRAYVDRAAGAEVFPVVTSRGPGIDEDVVWVEGTASLSSSVFSDASCTSRAAFINGCQPRPSFVVREADGALDPAACRLDFSIDELGPEIDSVFAGFGTICFQTFAGGARSVAGPAQLSGHLEGKLKRARPRARVESLIYRNDDGSKVPVGLFDTVRDAKCRLTFLEEGRYACVPENSPGARLLYEDAQCTIPVIAQSAFVRDAPEARSCFTGPRAVHEFDFDTGDVTAFISGPLAADQSGPLFFRSRDECFSSSASVDARYQVTRVETFTPGFFRIRRR